MRSLSRDFGGFLSNTPDLHGLGVGRSAGMNAENNSMLIMCHYPDLGSPSDWLEICFNQSEARGVTIHIPFDLIRF